MNLARTPFRVTALVVALSLLISSCASSNGYNASGQPLTPAEQRMRAQADDFNRTLVEGVAIGAVAGAALGALAGWAAGGGRGAAIGAGAGAVGGGLLGGAAGTYYAQKKQQYANSEDRLDAMIAEAKADNAKSETLLQDTRTVVRSDMQKLDQVQREVAARRMSQAQAQKELASVDANRSALQRSIGALTKRRDEWRQAAAEAKRDTSAKQVAQLDAEIQKLDQQISLMQTELNAINARRASVVG